MDFSFSKSVLIVKKDLQQKHLIIIRVIILYSVKVISFLKLMYVTNAFIIMMKLNIYVNMDNNIDKIFTEIDGDLKALRAMCDMDLQRVIIKNINDNLEQLIKMWKNTKNKL